MFTDNDTEISLIIIMGHVQHAHTYTHTYTHIFNGSKIRMSTAYRISHRVSDIRLVQHKHFYNFKRLDLKIY